MLGSTALTAYVATGLVTFAFSSPPSSLLPSPSVRTSSAYTRASMTYGTPFQPWAYPSLPISWPTSLKNESTQRSESSECQFTTATGASIITAPVRSDSCNGNGISASRMNETSSITPNNVTQTEFSYKTSSIVSACSLPSMPLTNEQQTGNSTWGTLCQSTFPLWLNDSSGISYYSAPWGDRTCSNSKASNRRDVPSTNTTRYYDFTLSRSRISSDGVLRDVILVNNQFPGPAIEANWGDWIQVIVHNNITDPVEGSAIHWHGLPQNGTNWYDGVVGGSQCPIAPGHSFTYTFLAQLYGTSWYHAHYSAQYTAGIAGPMIIYGPSQLPYDVDIGPIMLSDWYHVPYFSIVSDAVGTNASLIPPISDGVLINGRGQFNCSNPSYSTGTAWLGSSLSSSISWTCVDGAELAKFQFQPGKTHRLRLMNHGANGIQKFFIDGHSMTVIATDFVPTEPYETNVVTLGVGQRTDVLVTANNSSSATFWMRAQLPGGIVCGGATNPTVLAAVYYEGLADPAGLPNTISSVNDTSCDNQPLNVTQPLYTMKPSNDSYLQNLTMSLILNQTGSWEWPINNQSFRADFNAPLLFSAADGDVSFADDPQSNVYNFGSNKSVIFNVTNNTPVNHPMHLHGYTFFVLNEGKAGTTWDGNVINPSNPMRRDTQIVSAGGWIAISFEADNPGIWPFHCHIAWHLSGGMVLNVLVQPENIPQIAADIRAQTCDAWNEYTSNNVVDQIDAGS